MQSDKLLYFNETIFLLVHWKRLIVQHYFPEHFLDDFFGDGSGRYDVHGQT